MKNLLGVIVTAAMLSLAACGGGGGGAPAAMTPTPVPEAKAPPAAPEADQPSLADRIGPAEFGSIYQGTRPVSSVTRDPAHLNPNEIKITVAYEDGSARNLVFDYSANAIEGDSYIVGGDLTAFVVQRWRNSESVYGAWWHDESNGELGAAWVGVPSDYHDSFAYTATDNLPIVARGQAQGPAILSDGTLEEARTDIRVDIGATNAHWEFSVGATLGERTGGIEIIGSDGEPIDNLKVGQTFTLEGTHASWDGDAPLYIGSPEGDNAVTSGNAEGSWGGIGFHRLRGHFQFFGTVHLHGIQGRDDIDSILFLWDANDLP